MLTEIALLLLMQVGEPSSPSTQHVEPSAKPAGAPPSVRSVNSRKTAQEIERELLVKRLIKQQEESRGARNLDLPAIDAIEREVEALRATANGLAGEGERSEEILLTIPRDNQDLESLGVSDEKATGIRGLSGEVETLRAKLTLLRLRAPSANVPASELKDIEEFADEGKSEMASDHGMKVMPGEEVAQAEVQPPAPELRQAKEYPTRTASLLYKMQRYGELVKFVEEVGVDKLELSGRYLYAVALVSERRLDDARLVFSGLAEQEERRILAQASMRQVKRIDGEKLGVVGIDPLWTERNGK